MAIDGSSARSVEAPHAEHTVHEDPADRSRLRGDLIIALGAIIVLAYLVTYLMLPRDGFWINDNECKFIQLQGIVRTHYRDYSIAWPGKALDPEFSCSPLIDPFGHVTGGRLYCFYPPMFPLLSSFPYRLWGFDGLTLAPLLAGLLALSGVWYLAGFLPVRRTAQPLAVFLVALATPMWFYSMTFWEHTPAACLTTWSIAFCIKFVVDGRIRQAALSAVLCGLAIYLRDDLYILGVALAAVSILFGRRHRWGGSILFVLALAVTLVPLWWFQWGALGHPLGHHFTHHSPLESGVVRYLAERWSVARTFLINCHRSLWVSIVISAPCVILWCVYPRVPPRVFRWMVPLLAATATVGGVLALAGHLTAFSPMWWLVTSNSLFAVSPILILAFVRQANPQTASGQARRPDDDARIQRALWLILVLYVFVYVLVVPQLNSAGVHWGCRLVLSAYPLLGVMAAWTLARWWQGCHGRMRAWGVLVGVTVALSVVAQVYSLNLLRRRKAFSAKLNRAVAERPEDVVITNHAFIPQYLSHSFYDKMIFLPRDTQGWRRLRSALRRAGIRNILFVAARRPRRGAPPAGPKALRDGPLKYMSVELRPVKVEGLGRLRF